MKQKNQLEAAQKRLISLRYWLLGREYHLALRALAFNHPLFDGVRKDGVTPEFDHQVSQAHYARTLIGHLLYPEETIATIFFHDTCEDKDISPQEIRELYRDRPDFGAMVADESWRMTKKWRGEKRDEGMLFAEMAKHPVSSIAKGCDRIHNFQSMVGVFTIEKQKAYIEEGERLFLPMLKEAAARFPQQEPAYQNIRTMLRTQIALIRAGHEAFDARKD